MRILVCSDSHGRRSALEAAIVAQPEAKEVFFLGDIVRDAQELPRFFPDRTFHIVKGNCDFYDDAPASGLVRLSGVGIYFTHGHLHHVKSGLESLEQEALRQGAKIALYGHTHVACITYRDGIYLVNPGSLSSPRIGSASYAVIDLTPAGIVPVIIHL